MSCWRKASKVNQNVHRERHQPSSRAHLGLLEKKKDYKIRADDFNRKKKLLQKLKIKAVNRNPDEFYFHMINSKLIDGKYTEVKKEQLELSDEQNNLIKTQNSSYVSMKRTEEAKKIEKLQSQLHMIDIALAEGSGHFFLPDHEANISGVTYKKKTEAPKKQNVDVSKPKLNVEMLASQYVDCSIVNQKNNCLTSKEKCISKSTLDNIKHINTQKQKSYSELLKRISRVKKLGLVQRNIELLHALKDKSVSRPKLVKQGSESEAPIYLWTYQRKR